MPTLTHPIIEGEITVDDGPARVLAKSGWTPKSDGATAPNAPAKPAKGKPGSTPNPTTSPSVGEEN